jgi:Ca2+-binding EF-hand superfamily protein
MGKRQSQRREVELTDSGTGNGGFLAAVAGSFELEESDGMRRQGQQHFDLETGQQKQQPLPEGATFEQEDARGVEGVGGRAPVRPLRRVRLEGTGGRRSYGYTVDEEIYLSGRSCWCESDAHFRQVVFVVIHSVWAEAAVLGAIVAQTLLLAVSIRGEQHRWPTVVKWLPTLDWVFLFVFTIEMVARMIALGVFRGRHAYFSSRWNTLDGMLVFGSWGAVLVTATGIVTTLDPRMMRVIRCLRPLRAASFVGGIRSALAHWQFLVNIMAVLLFTLSLYGVLGIQLFGGALTYHCQPAASAWLDSSSSSGAPDGLECPPMIACSGLCVKNGGDSIGDGALEVSAGLSGLEDDVLKFDADQILKLRWGFDKLSDAVLTGWIVTTGDMWGVNMLRQIQLSDSRYASSATVFFSSYTLVMSLVVVNFFAAVLVQAYYTERIQRTDHAAMEEKIRKERALFNRMDTHAAGEIAVERLADVVDLLKLDATIHFDASEVREAMAEVDVDGSRTVDFAEFSRFWSSHSPYVVRVKKALRVQEDSIRTVWGRVDRNQDNSLSAEEMQELGTRLGITLLPSELRAAAEEMHVDEGGISFEVFVDWLLSPSKVAIKVRAATTSQTENSAATHLFSVMDTDRDGRLDVDDLVKGSKNCFGRQITRAEAAEIIKECSGGEAVATVSLPLFGSWFTSEQRWAARLRLKRQADIADVHHLLEQYSACNANSETPDTAEPRLFRDELAKMKKQLRIHQSVDELFVAISQINGPAEHVDNTSFGVEEFYRFLRDPDCAVASIVRAKFEAHQLKIERQRKRPFPYVPVLSPICFTVVSTKYFDHFIFSMVTANAIIMACEFHEMEKSNPFAFKIVHESERSFGVLFCAEAVAKILGVGGTKYFGAAGNRFDFFIVLFILAEFFLLAEDNSGSAGALRSARILVRSLRVARSARVVVQNHAVLMVIKTIVEARRNVLVLSAFAAFVLATLSIVGGLLLGECFTTADGSPDAHMPRVNYHTFVDSMHSIFLMTMGENWSHIMFAYAECVPTSWIFFVVCFGIMTFFVANLFVAVLVDGFSLSEEEKLIRQERNYTRRLHAESQMLRSAGHSVRSLMDVQAMRNSMTAAGKHLTGTKVLKKVGSGMRASRGKMAQLKQKASRIANTDRTAGDPKADWAWNIFPVDSKTRQFAKAVADDQRFEAVIIFFIVGTSISMALEGPDNTDHESWHGNAFLAVNSLTMIVFWIELIIKTIADGFIATPNAYLKDSWNRFDFFVVLTTTVELLLELLTSSGGTVSRCLRLLRILRPLRLVKRNESMLILLDALRLVLPTMTGVVILSMLFISIFAICGMGLFMGRFHSCVCTDISSGVCGANLDKDGCLAQDGQWQNPAYSFDNFPSALRALFWLSIGMGGAVIESGLDVTNVYVAPETHASWVYAPFYWVFMLLTNFFIWNIFIAILTNYFLESNGSALLTEAQSDWTQVQLACILVTPFEAQPPQKGSFRRYAHDIVSHRHFEPIVTAAILVNVVALYFERVPQTAEVESTLGHINLACLWFFTLDVTVRVSSIGLDGYLQSHWNKLDATVVTTSWMSTLGGETSALSVLRALRILRVILLAKKMDTMRPIIRALLLSVPPCFNVVCLIGLVLFIFAIVAMNIFGLQPKGKCIGQYDNFDNFASSFSMLVRICIGQDVMELTKEMEDNGIRSSFPFIAFFIIVMQFVFLNLFVVILVDSFMRSLVMSQLEVHDDHAQAFRNVWINGSTHPGGQFRGRRFTNSPRHAAIDFRMLHEFVPLLLPSTEARDASLQQSLLATLALLATPSIKSLTNITTLIPKLFSRHGQETSPLGLLVPHRIKHLDAVASPFTVGSIAHVRGRLCEIRECGWDAPEDRQAGQYPTSVRVCWIESDEIAYTRVLAQCRKVIPPVEGYSGFLDGDLDQPCVITWISRDRSLIKVQLDNPQREASTQTVSEEIGIDLAEHEFEARHVKRVTTGGDGTWMNRLAMELGVSTEEAQNGYRDCPQDVAVVDDDGTFLPAAVGLRAMPDGRFVQNIMVPFHDLLLALALIHMTYEGLTFSEQQQKWDVLRERAREYAARVIQAFACAKFAKRHLLREVPGAAVAHRGPPLKRWASFHRSFGSSDSHQQAQHWVFLIDSMRNGEWPLCAIARVQVEIISG